ncbi:MAG: aspartate kinase [Nitrospirae bacterium CG18_big_fil_WC_8_21_14_2_50_70_55]|nr:aspartate kinase [Deltaproteobacteria bacterium]OIP67187.1 MAG: aspartate kinase [Nitrospirae bacterium CG2_30_70_394]PIQ04861.1 MAG: aspartate kinase [Nitrospirae bacterium CG18_big_fil_WC_8_21_14_2_50_70_55]PIU78120.1 MAG: aspartate kinase [Nitrospirae bacterium CG06_land_8_20_14_3_00_70_43]PIW81907.1 MAG: aspartate kinase [Nitrospirae bacterium CG_4_8_14_3_um_filter_70_85]PIX83438.1 MAG: aspartate kinase [Nitrospirae bacterium CG_4_10_14_3_um_filter_70_108]
MALIVQKYGGTSVADLERIRAVCDRVAATVAQGHRVVVVLSAMSGETDRLVALGQKLSARPSPREMDLLLSSGERITVALLAIALDAAGIRARALTGRQAGIYTDTAHTKARIERIETATLTRLLDEGGVPVVAGFQGIVEEGGDSRVSTLGRGGSDTTAVALAAALNADVCEIYTDVDGIYTADPRIVSDARKIQRISFDEILELANLGAKVLHVRSVELAKKFNVPVHVRSSFSEAEGSWVVQGDAAMEQVVVSGIAYSQKEARVTVRGIPDRPGIAAQLFGALATAGVAVDMIVQSVGAAGHASISFTIPETDVQQANDTVAGLKEEMAIAAIEVDPAIAKVSIVGLGMQSHTGVAAKMFETLRAEGINILMISTSEIRISCIIARDQMATAVRALHTAFGLAVAPALVGR